MLKVTTEAEKKEGHLPGFLLCFSLEAKSKILSASIH